MIFYFIKRQISKDNTKERKLFVLSFINENIILKVIYNLLNTNTILKTIVTYLYASSTNGTINSQSRNLAIYWSNNEKNELIQFKDPHSFTLIKWPIFSSISIIKNIKFFKISYYLSKRYPLFISIRALSVALFYSNNKKSLRNKNIIISSESNPHANALMALSKNTLSTLGYTTHSPYIDNASKVICHYALVSNDYTKKQMISLDSEVNNYFIKPAKNLESENFLKQTVLIALSKNFSNTGLDKTIQLLQKNSLSNIVIRNHPNSLLKVNPKFNHLLSKNTYVIEDLKNAKFVIAGNSTIHLEAIEYDIPSYYSELIDKNKEMTLPFLNEREFPKIQDLFNAKYPRNYINQLKKSFLGTLNDNNNLELELKKLLKQ